MTKETEFKQRLVAVLADLDSNGRDDGEAMFLLGSGAARICDMAGKPTWSTMKQAISMTDFNRLLEQCRIEGNKFVAEGQHKAAYAIQALALSLVARTQADPDIRPGEQLLDTLIDAALANFRKHSTPSKLN
ncbi:hypothetical protein [Devosia sp. SL43]|uniref:hypothetical protein n=1 Tax=Devosia sp. SL43 TaxID=2806348 RepID=UPI001F2B15BF|nr:hypothetical protein [Devosia sp. SL43]UJW86867.1 hypothetical protein IM737_06355 [Devosia sp. SL43]